MKYKTPIKHKTYLSGVKSNQSSGVKHAHTDKPDKMKTSYVDIITNRNHDSGVTAFQLPKLRKVAVV